MSNQHCQSTELKALELSSSAKERDRPDKPNHGIWLCNSCLFIWNWRYCSFEKRRRQRDPSLSAVKSSTCVSVLTGVCEGWVAGATLPRVCEPRQRGRRRREPLSHTFAHRVADPVRLRTRTAQGLPPSQGSSECSVAALHRLVDHWSTG